MLGCPSGTVEPIPRQFAAAIRVDPRDERARLALREPPAKRWASGWRPAALRDAQSQHPGVRAPPGGSGELAVAAGEWTGAIGGV